MKDDPEQQVNEKWANENTSLPRHRRSRPSGNKSLRALLGILLLVFFIGGVYYFFQVRFTGRGEDLLQSKNAAFEQRLSGLEKQISDLQTKTGPGGPDPALLQRLEALAQRLETLERRAQPKIEPKSKPTPAKAAAAQKRYHAVQKGDTLYGISKKYRIGLEELRKSNPLSTGQSLRPGQKILIPPER
jgi:LysM repeat protein